MKIFIILFVLYFLTFISNVVLIRLRKRTKQMIFKFTTEVINVLTVFITLYIILNQFEATKDISTQFAKGGTIAIAVLSFAAQKGLSNVISGISISSSKAFLLGDKIRISNGSGNILAEGTVKDITMRHIIIWTYDGSTHTIPNSLIEDSVISKLNPNARLFVVIGYDSDINKALSIMGNICKNAKNSIGCGKAYIKEYTNNGIKLGITVYAEDNEKSFLVQTECYIALINEFKKNNISIPYNTNSICNN